MSEIFLIADPIDAAGTCEAIRQRLHTSFPRLRVLASGAPTATHLSRRSIVLLCIGAGWVSYLTGAQGPWLRQTLGTALQRHLTVIPVLLDGTSMPIAHEWPGDLLPLAYRNAARVARGATFPYDMDRLVRGVRSHLPAHQRIAYPVYTLVSALVTIAFFATGGAYLRFVMADDPRVVFAARIILIVEAGLWLVLWAFAVLRSFVCRQWVWVAFLLATVVIPLGSTLLFGIIGPREAPGESWSDLMRIRRQQARSPSIEMEFYGSRLARVANALGLAGAGVFLGGWILGLLASFQAFPQIHVVIFGVLPLFWIKSSVLVIVKTWGITLVFVDASLIAKYIDLRQRLLPAQGIVVERTPDHAVVRYTLRQGTTGTGVYRSQARSDWPPMGATLPILINPREPGTVIISRNGGSLVAQVIGVFVIALVGIAIIVATTVFAR